MRSYCKTLKSLWWFQPGCLAITWGTERSACSCTGQRYHCNWPDGRCLQFWWFCVVLSRCFKSFPDVPTFLCFTTYAPSWLFWNVYYSQEILLPLNNAWTCHFYIKYTFHIYFLKKAGVHVLLWSWSNNEKSTYALNTTRCWNASFSKIWECLVCQYLVYFIIFLCYPENCTITIYF